MSLMASFLPMHEFANHFCLDGQTFLSFSLSQDGKLQVMPGAVLAR
jgi:hypothetical protein